MELMNAPLLQTFWITGRLECLLLCSNGSGASARALRQPPWVACCLQPYVWTMVVEYNIAWISCNEDYCAGRAASALAWRDNWIQFNALHYGPPTDTEQAGSTEKPGPGPAGEGKYQVWYQEFWYLNNSDIRSCDISICPDIRVLKLWYQVQNLEPRNPNNPDITAHSCDIRISWYHSWRTPISEVLWYQGNSDISVLPISVILLYHKTRYHSIGYRQYSDITATPISQLRKMSSGIGCDIRIYGYHSSKLWYRSLARIQMTSTSTSSRIRNIPRKYLVYPSHTFRICNF